MANLKVNNEEFPATVIPHTTQNSHFEMRYFGTPTHIPESKDGTKAWSDGHIFGVHPTLEDSWDNQEDVELELADRPQPVAPFPTISGPNVHVKVLLVEPGHKGRLSIHENQVKREETTLKKVLFSLVDFSDFKRIKDLPETMKRQANVQERLNTILNEFPDSTEVNAVKPTNITLHAGQEWVISVTEDEERT